MGAPTYFTPNSPNPAEFAVPVTPSDTVDLLQVPRALYIGGTGSLSVLMQDGAAATFAAVAAGQPFAIRCKRVMATGTTVTGIVALY